MLNRMGLMQFTVECTYEQEIYVKKIVNCSSIIQTWLKVAKLLHRRHGMSF